MLVGVVVVPHLFREGGGDGGEHAYDEGGPVGKPDARNAPAEKEDCDAAVDVQQRIDAREDLLNHGINKSIRGLVNQYHITIIVGAIVYG